MTEYLRDLQMLSPRLSFAHSVLVDSKDIDIISEYVSSIIHNPLCNLVSGAGIAPVTKMLQAGVNVGLGTDSPNGGAHLSMFESMRLVGSLHNVSESDYRKWITPDQAFAMATQGGAKALNLSQDIGRLEEGMKADVSILNLVSTPLVPKNDLIFQLVYCECGYSVDTVIVGGKIVVQEGKAVNINEIDVMSEAIKVGEKIFRRNQPYFDFASKEEEYVWKIYARVHGIDE
jgi:5-methylthioadenosine/S-adenosylhomocysteine deaminase